MNRLGFAAEDLSRRARAPADSRWGEIGADAHFADADGKGGWRWQLERFERPLTASILPIDPRQLRRACWVPGVAQGLGEAGHHALRLLALRDESAESAGLKPAMTLESELIAGSRSAPRRRRRIRAHLYRGAHRWAGSASWPAATRTANPAPRAYRDPYTRRRKAHSHRGSRGDGYAVCLTSAEISAKRSARAVTLWGGRLSPPTKSPANARER